MTQQTGSVSLRSSPPQDVIDLWAGIPYLEDLPHALITKLAQAASSSKFEPDETIFDEGAPATALYLIEAGVVKITRFTKEGREHILHLLHRGDTFNDVAVMDGGPNPATAVAHSQCKIWRIRREDLHRIACEHPELAWALMESIARRTRYLIGIVEDLSMRSVRGRLAHLLLMQAGESDGEEVPRLLTQEQMASRLGTVREVVGRALRDLAADGIIEFDRHRIVILEPDRLAEEAGV